MSSAIPLVQEIVKAYDRYGNGAEEAVAQPQGEAAHPNPDG